MEAKGLIPLDLPGRFDDMSENTIPAPKKVIRTSTNGNSYVAYDVGDPVPIEDAIALGFAKAKPGSSSAAVSDAEDKAVTAPAARPRRTRKG